MSYSVDFGISSSDVWLCSVEKCLEMCGLEAYADAIVGTLNVEYRKRTTIAVELVAKVCRPDNILSRAC